MARLALLHAIFLLKADESLQDGSPSMQAGQGSCSLLKSAGGTMYTVEAFIGTPEQRLDLVVDTGSNLLIAEACECREQGYCDPSGKCFVRQASRSLAMANSSHGDQSTAILNFGSGAILTQVASDVVRVGQLAARLDRGLMLMVDQLLDFSGPFEGILGLGLPNSTEGPLALQNGRGALGPLRTAGAEGDGPQQAFGDFLGQAGVSRFSVCYGVEEPGVLRFDPPVVPGTLTSVGTMHWGLDFRGVSVGSAAAPQLGFCSKKAMTPGQQTPCGAIPDSGTTYIMGPEDQLIQLFEGICDAWPRCAGNYSSMLEAATQAKAAVLKQYGVDPWDIKPLPKPFIFEMLLHDCDSWYDEKKGMDELPHIYFHVADGVTGEVQALGLDGWAYAVSSKEKEVRITYRDIPGVGRVPVSHEYTGRLVWACRAAVGVMEYPTARNGPAWILGMPFFHKYTVGFDVSKAPPTVSFSPGPCGACSRGASLASTGNASSSKVARRPRRVEGLPRLPRARDPQPF